MSAEKLNEIFNKAKKWKLEMLALRRILLDCGLDEVYKWRQACYAFNGTNLFIIVSFKDACVLSFFKGVLLNDPKGILLQPGPNSQSVKIIKFTNVDEIIKLEKTLNSYIKESIENEKNGIKVPFKKIEEHTIPNELNTLFKANSKFEKAFKALTPGRQRAYLIYFSGAKQEATRIARIVKFKQRIMDGKGLND